MNFDEENILPAFWAKLLHPRLEDISKRTVFVSSIILND